MLEPTHKVQLVYLFPLEDAEESLRGHTVFEGWYNPIDCECAAPSLLAGFFEFEGTALECGCRLPSRSVLTPLFRRWNIMLPARLRGYGSTRADGQIV